MARALAYIHHQSLIHRDLKPQNILIDTSTNRVYLSDFGSAKKIIDNEQNVAYICSRYYRSPELIFGNTDYNNSIDIWSFGKFRLLLITIHTIHSNYIVNSKGCLIAEMFLGKPIFQGETTVDQLLQIIKVSKNLKHQYILKQIRY